MKFAKFFEWYKTKPLNYLIIHGITFSEEEGFTLSRIADEMGDCNCPHGHEYRPDTGHGWSVFEIDTDEEWQVEYHKRQQEGNSELPDVPSGEEVLDRFVKMVEDVLQNPPKCETCEKVLNLIKRNVNQWKCNSKLTSMEEEINQRSLPMNDDLIEQLREHADRVAGGTSGEPTYDPETLAIEHAAADEIERLRNEVEHLRVQLSGCGVAASANTREALARVCEVGSDAYGYSESYKECCRAAEREIQQRERAECAEAENDRLRTDNERLKDRVERLRITLGDVGRQATGALKLISAKGADR